jgi:hypothetical protein
MGTLLIVVTSLAALPASASMEVAGAPPSNLTLGYGPTGGLHLSWMAPAGTTPEAYIVYRDGVLIATVTATFFDDVASSAGVYAVTAVNGATQSTPGTFWFFAPAFLDQQLMRIEKMFAMTPETFPTGLVANPWDCGLIGVQLSPFGYAINMSCIPLAAGTAARATEHSP